MFKLWMEVVVAILVLGLEIIFLQAWHSDSLMTAEIAYVPEIRRPAEVLMVAVLAGGFFTSATLAQCFSGLFRLFCTVYAIAGALRLMEFLGSPAELIFPSGYVLEVFAVLLIATYTGNALMRMTSSR